MINWTDNQRQAIQKQGNILIEAGAGSGKTAVMVHRYLNYFLNDSKLKPQQVVMITFTKKAAQELKDRLQKTVQDPTYQSVKNRFENEANPFENITTIHGFCLQLIKQDPFLFEVDPEARIIQGSEEKDLQMQAIESVIISNMKAQSQVLLDLVKGASITKVIEEVQILLSNQKDATKWLEKYSEKEAVEQEFDLPESEWTQATKEAVQRYQGLWRLYKEVRKEYQKQKEKKGCMDFQDLLLTCTEGLWHQKKSNHLQGLYQHIMIDECQDTDPVQWQLVERLCDDFNALDAGKLCLVGDIKQAIYGFRGAEVNVFSDLLNQFNHHENSHVISLPHNFRSAPAIIDWVNPVFKEIFKNTPISYTPLEAGVDLKGQVYLNEAPSLKEELEQIAGFIIKQYQEKKINHFHDVAILVRKRNQIAPIKAICAKYNIPIQEDQLKSQSKLIADLNALFQVILDPSLKAPWLNVLTSPLMGQSMDVVMMCYQYPTGVFEALQDQSLIQKCQKSEQVQIKKMMKNLLGWLVEKKQMSALDLVLKVIQDIQLNDLAHHLPDQPHADKAVKQWLEETISDLQSAMSLSKWSQQCRYRQVNQNSTALPPKKEAVYITTMHASKGLEFPVVIVPHCEKKWQQYSAAPLVMTKEGIGMSYKKFDQQNQIRTAILDRQKNRFIAEEKRLFYVATTRAKQTLLLSKTKPKKEEKDSMWGCFSKLIVEKDNQFSMANQSNEHEWVYLEKISIVEQMINQEEPKKRDESPNVIIKKPDQKWLKKQTVSEYLGQSQSKNKAKTQWGTYYHQAIAYCNHHLNPSFIEVKKNLQLPGNLDNKPESDRLYQKIKAYLNHDNYQRVVKAKTRLIEHPFYLIKDQTLIHGRFDLAFEEEENWTLVDFKWSSKTDAPLFEQQIELRYEEQFELYKEALVQMLSKNKVIIEQW